MKNNTIFSMSILSSTPDATAIIRGGDGYPGIRGIANFYQTRWRVGAMVEVIRKEMILLRSHPVIPEIKLLAV